MIDLLVDQFIYIPDLCYMIEYLSNEQFHAFSYFYKHLRNLSNKEEYLRMLYLTQSGIFLKEVEQTFRNDWFPECITTTDSLVLCPSNNLLSKYPIKNFDSEMSYPLNLRHLQMIISVGNKFRRLLSGPSVLIDSLFPWAKGDTYVYFHSCIFHKSLQICWVAEESLHQKRSDHYNKRAVGYY